MSGVLEADLSWYEASLPSKERKRRGHFSTPRLLVEHILDACGYSPEADLSSVRILDPACGSGNFLVEAARRLAAFGLREGLSLEERARLVRRNVWGFDPDPVSCSLAEMQVRAVVGDDSNVGGEPGIWRSAEHGRAATPSGGRCVNPLGPYELNIHQADSLALPWEPCADVFVANPPYLAAKNTDLSGYQSALQRGQADSYLLFVELALAVVRPGGWIGLVLPDPVLARGNAARERSRLLEEMTIHHLWHLAGVFAADVGAVVIVGQKHPPTSSHSVSWVRERWQKRQTSYIPTGIIPQSLFLRQPGAELRYLLNSERSRAFEQLRMCVDETGGGNGRFAPLETFLSICRGEELGRESDSITRCIKPHQTLPVLRGGIDIHPYTIPHSDWCIAREAVRKPLERYLSPKLLVVKSTDRLQAVLDDRGHVVLQTLYLLHLRDKNGSIDDVYFFLALLNSRLLREYVFVLHTGYKWVQPQIEQRVLAQLPVPLVKARERLEIIERAKQLVNACSQSWAVVEWDEAIARMYEEQERAICALYDSALPGIGILSHEPRHAMPRLGARLALFQA